METELLSQYSTVIALIVAFFALIALIFNTLQFRLSVKQSMKSEKTERMIYKQRTMEFVTAQFDRLSVIGAREEMNKKGELEVLEYLSQFNGEIKNQKEQLFLEYIYTFNRIGAGISNGALDRDTVFNLWAPSFFTKHWAMSKTFLIEKRQHNENAYSFFDWLVKEECPKHTHNKAYSQ